MWQDVARDVARVSGGVCTGVCYAVQYAVHESPVVYTRGSRSLSLALAWKRPFTSPRGRGSAKLQVRTQQQNGPAAARCRSRFAHHAHAHGAHGKHDAAEASAASRHRRHHRSSYTAGAVERPWPRGGRSQSRASVDRPPRASIRAPARKKIINTCASTVICIATTGSAGAGDLSGHVSGAFFAHFGFRRRAPVVR